MTGYTLLLLFLGCSEEQDSADHISNIDIGSSWENGYCEDIELSHRPIGTPNCQNGRCLIEEGTFWMGSNQRPDECPMQEIHVDSFWIDETEVTIAEWKRCQNDGICDAIPIHCLNLLENRSDFSEDLPAICISWEEANQYCSFVGGRLPTEAEWEKAARGQDGATWAWGDLAPDCERANYRVASIYCYGGSTNPVGYYEDSRSAYGLFDSNGNVFEWVADFYDARYYQKGETQNPKGSMDLCYSTVDGREEFCHYRVLRGGAYNTTESVIRGSSRSFAEGDLVDVNIGVRCAYDD